MTSGSVFCSFEFLSSVRRRAFFFQTESLFQRFESMIEWNDEREQRRKRLCDLISDATSINSQGKQIDELIHLSEKPFQSNNTLFEKDLYYLFADYYLKMPSKDASSNDTAKKFVRSTFFLFSSFYRQKQRFVFVEKLKNIISKIFV